MHILNDYVIMNFMKERRDLRSHHLYKFLCAHNLIDRFIKNVVNQKHTNDRKRAMLRFLANEESFIDALKEIGCIDYAFTWAETPEGQVFWSKLNNKEEKSFECRWKEYKDLMIALDIVRKNKT